MARLAIHYIGNLLRQLRLLYFKILGVKIGKRTMVSLGAKLDVRRGQITIGSDCLITHGCYILSHDGAAHVLSRDDNGSGSVTIGNHVFIGVNSVILRNVTIGDHAIIGSGAVVINDIPEGAVAVGNPARVIKVLEKPYRALPKKHDVRVTLT